MDDALMEKAIEDAGGNAPEIRKVLSAFEGKKADAAEYLVRSMVGRNSIIGTGLDSIEMLYLELPHKNGSWMFDSLQMARGKSFMAMPKNEVPDLQNISAQYLIKNINDAWEWREKRAWNKDLSEEEFCELLLPYRIGNEPITYWREAYRQVYDSLSPKIDSSSSSIDAARLIAKTLGEVHYNNRLTTPHRPATGLLAAPVGYCREDCDRTVYALRAFGIPVAIDNIVASPDNGTPHQWCVALDTEDHTYRMFDNKRFLPTRDSIHNDGRRKGKVYRETSDMNFDRLKRFENAVNPPGALMNPHFKDVTSEYFGKNKAKVKINNNCGTTYLGIFTPAGYKPIDIAEEISGNRATFRNIEPDLIYFPISSDDNSTEAYSVNGMPFMLLADGKVHRFNPSDKLEEITLSRKMPFWLHHEERMSSVVGCKVQTGPTAIGPWTDVDSISSMPKHSFYRIPVSMDKSERYIRILPTPMHRSQIGEIIAATDSLALERLPLSVITTNLTAGKKKLVDGDILTWTNYKVGYKDLIFRIDSDKEVNNIFVVPRNDDNYVVPGEEYELFYFAEDGWKSLGRKVAEGFSLSYDVPKNAVLWLRNLTKGNEEQIFICRNGRQAFNADLRLNNY